MKKILALVLALVMCLALVACGSSAPAASAGADAAPAKLVVGTSADYAPFDFMYADENGDMQFGGIDMFTAEYIAEQMGMDIQIENMSFDYLLVALAKGDFDMVIGAMEASEERQQSADFSDPYYQDIPARILIRAEDADKFQTLADFDGVSVGAQTATTKEGLVTEMMDGANLVSLALVTDLVNELVYGKIDAIMLDGSVAEQYAATNDSLVISAASDELPNADPYCIAVAKGDPKGLLEGINAAIAKMNEENMMATFIERADALGDVAVEVSADAPEA